jgi:hypothetical protein
VLGFCPVSKIESGERPVDVVELSNLARTYRKPLDFLCSGKEKPKGRMQFSMHYERAPRFRRPKLDGSAASAALA